MPAAGPDKPITEDPPKPGITYQQVTTGQVEKVIDKIVAGQPLTNADLQGWGPNAVRTLTRSYADRIQNDYSKACDLIHDAAAGKISADKLATELKGINTVQVRDIIGNANIQPGMPRLDQADLIRKVMVNMRDVSTNIGQVTNDRMSAASAPPVLTQVAKNKFTPPPDTVIPETSNGNVKYDQVKPSQAMQVAHDLLAGKDVSATISNWGGKSLQALLVEYREHTWPEDLAKARQALSAIGSPEYAEQLKNIQSPGLKALVEKENADFTGQKKSRAEINYDFDVQQANVFGNGIEVYNRATDKYQAQELKLYQEKMAKDRAGATPDRTTGANGTTVISPTSDAAQAAMQFAREINPRKWPDLSGWSDEKRDTVFGAYTTTMKKDLDQAKDVVNKLLQGGTDPKTWNLDGIQNPVLKDTIRRDIASQDSDMIIRDLDKRASNTTDFVKMQIYTVNSPAPPQKVVNNAPAPGR
jgi:hypothetical protein